MACWFFPEIFFNKKRFLIQTNFEPGWKSCIQTRSKLIHLLDFLKHFHRHFVNKFSFLKRFENTTNLIHSTNFQCCLISLKNYPLYKDDTTVHFGDYNIYTKYLYLKYLHWVGLKIVIDSKFKKKIEIKVTSYKVYN